MIRTFLTPLAALAAGAALAFAGPALGQTQEDAPEAEQAEMTKGEKRLAKLLEGRQAGEPMNCIRTLPNQPMQTIDGTAYVYGRGNTIYVQRTNDPEDIDSNEVLVSRRFNATQLCRQDVMTTVDPMLGFFTGAVFFDRFVPYTRVKDEGGEASEG